MTADLYALVENFRVQNCAQRTNCGKVYKVFKKKKSVNYNSKGEEIIFQFRFQFFNGARENKKSPSSRQN